MAITLSGVTAYVDEQKSGLIQKAILGAKSASLFTLQTGIKSAETLNLLTNSVVFGDGTACGFTDGGETNVSQRTLTVGAIKINKSYCLPELEKYFTQKYVVAGNPEDLDGTIAGEFVDGVIKETNKELEVAIWQGDTNSASANLNKFDGLIKILTGATGTVQITGSTGTTIDRINAAYAAIPVQLLDSEDLTIFVGADMARTYTAELIAANNYHFVGDEMIVLGTNVKVEAVNGLNGTNIIVAGRKQDIFYGTDLENGQEDVNFRYVDSADAFWLTIKFKAGVQVSFPEQIVISLPA